MLQEKNELPQKKQLHISKIAFFDYAKDYNEQTGLDPFERKLKDPMLLTHPFAPFTIRSQVAPRPYSVRFLGTYIEEIELSLN
jgi:hypothetical protein